MLVIVIILVKQFECCFQERHDVSFAILAQYTRLISQVPCLCSAQGQFCVYILFNIVVIFTSLIFLYDVFFPSVKYSFTLSFFLSSFLSSFLSFCLPYFFFLSFPFVPVLDLFLFPMCVFLFFVYQRHFFFTLLLNFSFS